MVENQVGEQERSGVESLAGELIEAAFQAGEEGGGNDPEIEALQEMLRRGVALLSPVQQATLREQCSEYLSLLGQKGTEVD